MFLKNILKSWDNARVKLYSQVHLYLCCIRKQIELKFSIQYFLQTKLTEPDLSFPDLTCPDSTRPNLTRPDLTHPDLTQPDVIWPDLTDLYSISRHPPYM